MDDDIILKIANSNKEIIDFQKFLFDIYCVQLNWHDKNKFPDEIFVDKYDQYSVFLVVYSGDKIVAGLRLVDDSTIGFPHESIIGNKLPELNQTIDENIRKKVLQTGRSGIREITRLVSRKKGRRILSFDLMKCLHWYGLYNQIDIYFMVIDIQFFLLCHKINIPLVPVGIPTYCEGSWTLPSIMILDDIRQNLKQKDPKVWRYLSNKNNLIGNWNQNKY